MLDQNFFSCLKTDSQSNNHGNPLIMQLMVRAFEPSPALARLPLLGKEGSGRKRALQRVLLSRRSGNDRKSHDDSLWLPLLVSLSERSGEGWGEVLQKEVRRGLG